MAYVITVKSEGRTLYLADNSKTSICGIVFSINANHALIFPNEEVASNRLRLLNHVGFVKGISVNRLLQA